MNKSQDTTAALLETIKKAAAKEEGKRMAIVIDGPSCSGKTTLASRLAALLQCPCLSTDEFYYPAQSRPQNWNQTALGNYDRKRMDLQICQPFNNNQTKLLYDSFDCKTQSAQTKHFPVGQLIIVEGCGSFQLPFQNSLKIFLSIDPKTQMERIQKRNGLQAQAFETIWLPMEALYFSQYQPQDKADLTASGLELSK